MARYKRLIALVVDIILIFFAFSASFLLRFDFRVPPDMREIYIYGLYVVLIVKPIVFATSGLYRSLWRYASLQDAIEIFKAVTISSAFSAFAILFIRHFAPYPRSIFILDWFILFFMISASRLVWRIVRETDIISRGRKGKRTLIIGAGETGSNLLKEIRRQPDSPYDVIGFVDNDVNKRGMRLHGVPILGEIRHLKAFIRTNKVEDVIIAMPAAHGKLMRSIVDSCEKAKVRFKTLPSIGDLIEGNVSVSQIKDVDIEDLLGRAPVTLDEISIRSYLTGKKVLVSGAAGSIGSEICRQIARYTPESMIVLDSAETPLFYVERELSLKYRDLRLIPLIGDVRDSDRIESIFREYTPDVVFHAAAYKHVPMMEYNPVEAITNNVQGTKNIADASDRFHVDNFVMISTDKAVNPANIMGASKRIAEIYVQALSTESKTKYTTVRFGNVLDSNGSVIPLFKEQIKSGGPVTVTDPNVIRYFMTIPEASQLVLQAGCIGNGGEIFVLEMGEPVRIVELAEELIRLSGFVPHEDIEIAFIGLRPGEKLFEELLVEGEGIKPTRHDKIKVLAATKYELNMVTVELEKLIARARKADIEGLLLSIHRLVPEFNPKNQLDGPRVSSLWNDNRIP